MKCEIPGETPGDVNGVKYPVEFPSGQKWVKFTEINLQNYVLGVFQVTLCTMRCVHGSNYEILTEWDPGPIYLVQRLWDPGGPSYTSRSSVPINLEKLGQPKSYLYYIYLPGLSSLPFLVVLMSILAPKLNSGKQDHMGGFRYLPRLDQ